MLELIHSKYLAQYLLRCTRILQILCHLHMIQALMLQALQISQATLHSKMTIELNIYGLHQETPNLF